MKTMSDYTMSCAPEQTRKAFDLGAPIDKARVIDTIEGKSIRIPEDTGDFYICPTSEQMIGWLESQGFDFETTKIYTVLEHDKIGTMGFYEGTRKEATITAIDAALEYLSSKK